LIDFIKYGILNIDINQLKQNQYLEFKAKLNLKTGQVYPYAEARYRNLIFKVYEPTKSNPFGRVTLEGSFHKYWNYGKHNFNDFSFHNVNNVVNELKDKFNIDPIKTVLKQLEIGVNISPGYNVEDIISGCIMHFKKPFKSIHTKIKGNYMLADHQRYRIKVYDKKLQYQDFFKIKNELMRFEIKFAKMEDLKNLGIVSLDDLLMFELNYFKSLLIEKWDEILFYDKLVFENHKNKFKYSNPNFWNELNKNLFKYHKRELNKAIKESSISIKDHIRNLIEDKYDSLI